eukprot:403350523
MDFGGLGSVSASEMRKLRIKEFIQANEKQMLDGKIPNIHSYNPSKTDLDNARFVSKYFDLVNNKQYQSMFCQYNEIMFAKLFLTMKWRELERGQLLYTKGDNSKYFYFALRGKLEILVDNTQLPTDGINQDQFKFSKNADESEIFGLKSASSDIRNEYARAASEKVEIISIDRDLYDQIVKKTQLSSSEQKIDFLIRYVPKFRAVSRKMIEEMEVLFNKEVATQGYVFQKQDDQDDYLYFVFRGKMRVLLSTQTQYLGEQIFPEQIQQDKNKKHLVIGYIQRGECFGEHSALNDLPNPYTIEVFTKKAEVYKILRSNFVQYFGGLQGEPVERLRASILLKQNWLKSKLELLRSLSLNQLETGLEYKNEAEHAKLKPTKEFVKEVPFIKNNPRLQNGDQQSNGNSNSDEPRKPTTMTAKQMEIQRMKESLLRPIPQRGGGVVASQPVKDDKQDEDKFKRQMAWGTPRLVTQNRSLVLDENQIKQRSYLQSMAAQRKGIMDGNQEEKKSDFKAASVTSFREKMLIAEKMEIQNTDSQTNGIVEAKVEQQPLPQMRPPGVQVGGITIGGGAAGGGGQSMFNKFRNANDEDIKNKLKSGGFRGLPL